MTVLSKRMGSERSIGIFPSVDIVAERLCGLLEKVANDSISENGSFKVGLSGGSQVKLLAQGLRKINTDWSKWVFFFCDERIVPPDSPDSTFGEYQRHVIGTIPVSESQFVQITPGLSANDTAEDYRKKMEKYFNPNSIPRFNAVLLGLGEDGHTCSLFPGHELLKEDKLWVAAITDSPKPPPERITFTYPVLNNSECCVIAATGNSKASIAKRLLVDDEPLPINLIRPRDGRSYWLLDEAAGALVEWKK